VQEALSKLPPHERACVEERCVDQSVTSRKEAAEKGAEQTGRSERTVYRALKHFETALIDLMQEPDDD